MVGIRRADYACLLAWIDASEHVWMKNWGHGPRTPRVSGEAANLKFSGYLFYFKQKEKPVLFSNQIFAK